MPRLSPDDPISKALARFRELAGAIEARANLAELEDAEGALWDAATSHDPRHRRTFEHYTGGCLAGHPTELIAELGREDQ